MIPQNNACTEDWVLCYVLLLPSKTIRFIAALFVFAAVRFPACMLMFPFVDIALPIITCLPADHHSLACLWDCPSNACASCE